MHQEITPIIRHINLIQILPQIVNDNRSPYLRIFKDPHGFQTQFLTHHDSLRVNKWKKKENYEKKNGSNRNLKVFKNKLYEGECSVH